MTLVEIAKIVWENRRTFLFGGTAQWDPNTFLSEWFEENSNDELRETIARSGWYWFEFGGNVEILRNVIEPDNLPKQACRFASLSTSNFDLFYNSLCHPINGRTVVYNGHEQNIYSRVRSHFALNNDNTGALGIRSYQSLSTIPWAVQIFHKGYIDAITDITDAQRSELLKFCNSNIGRTAIEQSWRSIYGWPILSRA